MPLQRYCGAQLLVPIGGIMGVGMGRIDGGAIGAIWGGRGGTMSSVLEQTGIWRQPPPIAEQSQVQMQAACAIPAAALLRTRTTSKRCIVRLLDVHDAPIPARTPGTCVGANR
jgi:hypothetical protein